MTEREEMENGADISEDERSSALRARRSVREALKSFRVTAKNPDTPVRYSAGTHRALQEMLAMQQLMIGRLADRIEKLEARPIQRYMGVWSPEREYQADNQVTFSGGLWVAKGCSKGARPGKSPDLWQLCVKRGGAG